MNRDFVFLLNAYDIDPGAYTPKIMTMLDFNLWSWNSRFFPGIDPLMVRKNDDRRRAVRLGRDGRHVLDGQSSQGPKGRRYKDPGWYKHPAGEVVYEWTGSLPDPARFAAEGGKTMPVHNMPAKEVEVQVRKPMANMKH